MANTFLPRFFLYHDSRDKKVVQKIRNRLSPYSCYIWFFPKALKSGLSLQSVLGKESEFLKTDWIIGVLSPRTVKAAWFNDIIKEKNTPLLRQAGTRKLVAVLETNLKLKARTWLPVVNFAPDFEKGFTKLLNIVLSEANDPGGFQDRVLEMIKAIRGGKDDVWACICGLRAITHEVIRRRYILEKLHRKEIPDKKKEMGAWDKLDYIRRVTKHPFDNAVFQLMKERQGEFECDSDVRQVLAGKLNKFTADLDAYGKDMKILCALR